MSVLEIMERLLKLENAVIHLEKKIQEKDILEFWIRQKFDYDAQAVSQLMDEEMKRTNNETTLLQGTNNNTAQENDTNNINHGTRSGYENLLSVLQAPPKSHLRQFSFTTNVHDDDNNRNDTHNDTNGMNLVMDHEGKSIDPFDSGVGDNFPLSMEQDYNCDELGIDEKGTKNIDIYDYDESSHGTTISTSTLPNNSNHNNFPSEKIDFGSYFEAESRRGNNSTGTPSKTRTRKSKTDSTSGVRCKYCKKDFAKTYIFRHQKKCKWKLSAVASPSKEELVQQSIESASQPAEDQKTDPFISAVVMCHGGGENIVSDCGNTNSSASTPVMPLDENSADEEKATSSATEPKLRFSCKVCSQSFLTLRACRQHIVTEHIAHVLNTPLIPSDAAFRIIENNNMNSNINGLPPSSSGLNFNTNLVGPNNGPIQNLTNLTLLGLSASSPGNVMTMSTPLLQSELRGGGGGSKFNPNNSKDIILKQLFQHPILRVRDKNSLDLSNNSILQEKKHQVKSRGSTPTSTITTIATNDNDSITVNSHQNLSSTLSNNTNNNNSNSNSNQQIKSQGFTYPCLHCKNINISKNFQNLQDLHLHVLQCHIIKVHRQGLPILENDNVSTFSFGNDESRLNQSFSLPVFNIRGGDSNQSLNLSAIINPSNNLQQPQSLVIGDFQSDNILNNGQSQSLTQTQSQQPVFKCGVCSFTFQDFATAEDHARECHTLPHFQKQEVVETRALESSPVNHSNGSSSNSNTDNQSVAIDLIRSTFGDSIFMCPSGP